MAISVFTHSSPCIPPSTQVSLYYNSVNSSNTTQGDLGVYFTEDATISLGDVINTPTQCSQGIDVVFIVDYTGSMSGAINGVKAGIANIINTISLESLNNARIGLVIFDEYSANAAPNYGLKSTYTNLPAAQKFINRNFGVGRAQHITALAPMSSVNNFTDFNAKLALLNTSDFPLGHGEGTPEPGDLGTYEVVKNNLAGAWRAEAIKVIVLITDAVPGGNDDSNTSADLTYLNNILLPAVNARGAQVMVQSSEFASASGNYYNQLAYSSTIPGRYDQVTFDSGGNWINTGLIAGIQTLCDETYYATCNLANTGWYHRSGDCYNFYFDANLGVVTDIYTLPSAYNVTVNTTSTDENSRNIIWSVDTACVSNGTTLYWTIGPGSTADSNDFIDAISGGSFTINSNTGSFQLTTRNDNITEGTEYIQVQIRTGSVSGPVITTSDFTLISDTSVSPTERPASPTPTPTAVSSGGGTGPTATPVGDPFIDPGDGRDGGSVTPTATPSTTSQNCENWTLYGGSDMGRSFTFTRCGETTTTTLNIPAGDATTECIVMPWNGATGAVREFESCSGGPNPTPIATEPEYVYLMDPCDGSSRYVVAKTNSPKSIGSVWDLTGSFYADTNPYTIIATSTQPFETTIAMGYVNCDAGFCLLAGTMITLADGTQKTIETVVAGNELKSMIIGDMPDSDNYEALKVWSQASPTVSNTNTIVQNNTMSTVDSVLSFNGGRLTSSKDHLHIIKRSGNWMVIKASTIIVGDIFINESAQEVVIGSIQELTGTFNVYKLDVETSDTYFANGIITHNSKYLP